VCSSDLTVNAPCGVLLDRTVTDSNPLELGIEVPPGQQTVEAAVKVSRSWRPSQYGERDTRELGAGLTSDFVSGPDRMHQLNGPSIDLASCGHAG